MIICIQPVEQWTGATDLDKATYLEILDGVDPDQEANSFYYGENHLLLIEHFIKLGAKVVENPIKTYFV